MSTALVLVGLALQLSGAGITAQGIRLILRDVAAPDDTLTSPAKNAVTRAAHKLRAVWRRLLGHAPRDVVLQDSPAAIRLGGSGEGVNTYPSLPSDLPLTAAIEQLDERTREAIEAISEVREALANESSARRLEAASVRDELSRAIESQAERERKRLLAGLRYESVGLAMLTLGSLISAMGSLVPPE